MGQIRCIMEMGIDLVHACKGNLSHPVYLSQKWFTIRKRHIAEQHKLKFGPHSSHMGTFDLEHANVILGLSWFGPERLQLGNGSS